MSRNSLRVARLLLRLQELAQPGEGVVELVAVAPLLLVEPVGRDAFLGDAVHLAGADLDLDRVALGPDHRRVERLVHVDLGHRDEVLEAAGHRLPQRVHDAEGAVAVADRIGEHADRGEVVDLVELAPALVHLLPDRVEVLGPARDLGPDPHLGQLLVEERDQVVDLRLALEPPLGDAAHQLLVVVRVQDPEGQVLQLGLDLGHAQAGGRAGRRCRGSPGRSSWPCRWAGSASVRMLCSRSASLIISTRRSRAMATSILRKFSAWRSSREEKASLPILVTPSTSSAISAAELALEVPLGGRGVLQHVVEEAGRHGGHVHLEVRRGGRRPRGGGRGRARPEARC